MAEAAAGVHVAFDEREGELCHIEPAGLAQHGAGIRERRDRQAVPVSERLVVEARAYTLAARRQQLFSQGRKPRVGSCAAIIWKAGLRGRFPLIIQQLETIENIMSLEISCRRHVIKTRKI